MYSCWTNNTCILFLVMGVQSSLTFLVFPPASPQESARTLVSSCKCMTAPKEKKRGLQVSLPLCHYFCWLLRYWLRPQTHGVAPCWGSTRHALKGHWAVVFPRVEWHHEWCRLNERKMFVWEITGLGTSFDKYNCVWFNCCFAYGFIVDF